MTKSDAIEAILRFNPSASPEFLDGFSAEELAEYLDRLTGPGLRHRNDAEPRHTNANPTIRAAASRAVDLADPFPAYPVSTE